MHTSGHRNTHHPKKAEVSAGKTRKQVWTLRFVTGAGARTPNERGGGTLELPRHACLWSHCYNYRLAEARHNNTAESSNYTPE